MCAAPKPVRVGNNSTNRPPWLGAHNRSSRLVGPCVMLSTTTPNQEKDCAASLLLKGHTAPVLCLASWEDKWLASGSEDGTARLWAPETSDPLRLTLQCEREVQAIALCPRSAVEIEKSPSRDDVGTGASPSLPSSTNHLPVVMLLFACDNTLFAYDLSNATAENEPLSPIEVSLESCQALWQANDEINQIVWTTAPLPSIGPTTGSRKKKKKAGSTQYSSSSASLWIAAADDAGQIWLATAPWQTNIPSHTTILTHSNEGALCLTTALRKTVKGKLDVLTGGSDCRIMQWQVLSNSTAFKLTSQLLIDLQSATAPEQSAGQPLWNPPMVHHITWINSDWAAAACGDGQVRLLQRTGGRWVLMAQVEHGAVPACAVAAAVHGGVETLTVDTPTATTILGTAGNDGILKLWNVESLVKDNPDQDLQETSPSLVRTIEHGPKPNAMITTSAKEGVMLWIADTTNNISGYFSRRQI